MSKRAGRNLLEFLILYRFVQMESTWKSIVLFSIYYEMLIYLISYKLRIILLKKIKLYCMYATWSPNHKHIWIVVLKLAQMESTWKSWYSFHNSINIDRFLIPCELRTVLLIDNMNICLQYEITTMSTQL